MYLPFLNLAAPLRNQALTNEESICNARLQSSSAESNLSNLFAAAALLEYNTAAVLLVPDSECALSSAMAML